MRLSIFPLLFLAYLLAEIAAFILVGDAIGVLPTLGLILLSGVVGVVLMRHQGFGVISRLRSEQSAGRVPGREILHGFMILLAGVLLLLPGFLTDIVGLLLFIPAVRDGAWNIIRDKITIVTNRRGFASGFGTRSPRDRVVDLDDDEFSRTDRPEPPSRARSGSSGESPWLDHDKG